MEPEARDARSSAPSNRAKPLLPAWISWASLLIAWGLAIACMLGTATAADGALRGLGLPDGSASLAVLVILVFLATGIHEGGHVLAARISGMRVMRVQVGPVAFKPWGRGWRCSFRGPGRGIGGWVLAFPDPRRPIKPAMMRMAAGGPLANLLVAAIAAIPAWRWNAAEAGFFAGFAMVNAGLGLGNLLPHARYYVSDGFALLACLRGWREDDPSLALVRLMGLSAFGTTADRLPAALVDQLQSQGPAMQLVVAWFRLKGAQNTGRWDTVDELEARVNEISARMTQAERVACKEMLVMLRLELAFSQALQAHRPEPLQLLSESKAIDWHAPHLRPRFSALRHALTGERDAMERDLLEAARLSLASPDLALHESEARMAASIRRVLEPSKPALSAAPAA